MCQDPFFFSLSYCWRGPCLAEGMATPRRLRRQERPAAEPVGRPSSVWRGRARRIWSNSWPVALPPLPPLDSPRLRLHRRRRAPLAVRPDATAAWRGRYVSSGTWTWIRTDSYAAVSTIHHHHHHCRRLLIQQPPTPSSPNRTHSPQLVCREEPLLPPTDDDDDDRF